MRAISVNFRAGIYDTEGYLGLTLVAAGAMVWRRWHEPAVRLLILFAAVIGVLSMGSWMQVGGHFIVPMPWMAVSALPLIGKAVPARLTVYMFLAIAILCAMWLSASAARRAESCRPALAHGSTDRAFAPALPRRAVLVHGAGDARVLLRRALWPVSRAG